MNGRRVVYLIRLESLSPFMLTPLPLFAAARFTEEAMY